MLTSDITFEKIVEKTKRMLGKNYRGDKEMVPAYSTPVPIEGHTDSFLTVSNGGFTNDEITFIQNKTKNYAWWIAFRGYLIDDSRVEIPALFIQGSESGSATPDVLNINGATSNGFYMPIERTDVTGEVVTTSNHMYVRFVSVMAMMIADVLAGSLVIEPVFSLPGLGRLLVVSVANRDYPVVQLIVLYIATLVVVLNGVVDILYQVLDPRVKDMV